MSGFKAFTPITDVKELQGIVARLDRELREERWVNESQAAKIRELYGQQQLDREQKLWELYVKLVNREDRRVRDGLFTLVE